MKTKRFTKLAALLLCIAMVLFAFTTLLGNFYYVENGFAYILKRTPDKAFTNAMRVAGAVLVFLGAIVSFGFYKPRFKDLFGTLITLLCITFAVFVISMILRWSGLHPKANYFFTVETEGNFILDLFHSWIPVPFLYLLPCAAILTPYILLLTLPFELLGKKSKDNGS